MFSFCLRQTLISCTNYLSENTTTMNSSSSTTKLKGNQTNFYIENFIVDIIANGKGNSVLQHINVGPRDGGKKLENLFPLQRFIRSGVSYMHECIFTESHFSYVVRFHKSEKKESLNVVYICNMQEKYSKFSR